MQGEALRESFKSGLCKLLSLSTRQQGMKQVRSLIMQYKTTSSLRTWLSVLSEKRQKHTESEITILAFIIEQYGSGLLDPLDKVPSLQKTVFRITQLLTRSFNDASAGAACQKAWVQLYLSTLGNQLPDFNKKLLFDGLEAMLLGGADRLSQTTAQLIIDGLLEAALARQDHQFFKIISKRALVLFLKTSIPHWAALTSLQTILAYFGVNNLTPLLEQICGKVVQQVQHAQKDSNGFRIKTQAANALCLVGEQINTDGMAIYSLIGGVLEDLASDRVWAVQSAGKKANGVWRQKKQKWEEQFQDKQKQYVPQKIQKQMQQYPVESRNMSKMGVEQRNIPQQNQYVNKPYQQMYHSQPQQFYNKPQQMYSSQNQQMQNIPIYSGQPMYNPPPQAYNRAKQVQGRAENINRQYVTANNFYPPNQEQKPANSASEWNPQQKKYLQKYTGVNASNFLQARRPVESYNQKIQQIKRNVYNPKHQYTQFDETIPWLDGQNLPRPQSQPQPQPQSQPQIESERSDKKLLLEWQQAVRLADGAQMQEAVSLLLRMDDDMYLLRFLLLYSNVLEKVNKRTAAALLKTMLRIHTSAFLDGTLIKLTKETIKSGIAPLLPNATTAKIRKALDMCNHSKLQQVVEKTKKNFENALSQ